MITEPGDRFLTVTFDQRLLDQTLTKPPWTVRYEGQNQELINIDVVGSTVFMKIQDVGIDPGISRVNYDDTLGEIVGFYGRLPAVSFTDFPIT